jgi:membrane-associated phospholipid phosphatase
VISAVPLTAARHVAVVALLALGALAPASAAAQSVVPAATTPVPAPVLGPVSGAALRLGATPSLLRGDGHWRGGILFDEGFRSAIRLSAIEDQEVARQISDVLLVGTMVGVFASDVLGAPLAQGDGDLAWRAGFAYVAAIGVTMAAGELIKHAVGRARPFERDCEEDPERHGCDDGDIFSSVYSLHSGMAFTAAGFSCSMHLSSGLYGDTAADATACGISLALAATTGLLRVVSDRHYLSDVLVGAALGFLVGYLMPLAIVPDVGAAPPPAAAASSQAVSAPGGGMIGLTFSGEF